MKSEYQVMYMLLALVFFICCNYFISKRREKSLLIHRKGTVGIVTHYNKDAGSSGGSLYYKFTIGGEIYKGSKGDNLIRRKGVKYLFIGKTFPVVYDSTNPKYSHIIIDPADFRKYKLRFPDSLNWVRPYFE